jgi:hypothetical protein
LPLPGVEVDGEELGALVAREAGKMYVLNTAGAWLWLRGMKWELRARKYLGLEGRLYLRCVWAAREWR